MAVTQPLLQSLTKCWSVCRVVSALLAMFSLCIVLAEATISGSLPNMSVFSRVLHHTAQNQFVTELLTFLFLCYPCMCAYYAIYKLGRFNFYLLVPRYFCLHTSHSKR